MSLVQKLELRQGQTLMMTPQLAQAIKLLQMPHFELQAFVDAEVESNPLLDRAENDDNISDPPPGPAEVPTFDEAAITGDVGAVAVENPDDWFFSERQPGDGDLEQMFDSPMENVFPDDNTSRDQAETFKPSHYSGSSRSDDLPEIGQVFSRELSLREHLMRQLDLATADPVRRLIGSHLIDAIDGNGYLTVSLAEVAQRLNADESAVEATLALIHTFEPTGIGARNLLECLTLQLRERDRLDPAMQCCLARLDLVAKRDLAGLKRQCHVDNEDLAEIITEIRNLDPKPGSSFGSEPVEVLLPDVFVRARPDGDWHIELNPETMPRVLVNQDYYATLTGRGSRQTNSSGQDKVFLTECLAKANWLTRSLEQRARTILKVATEIVRQQQDFFLHGVSHLRPLTLRQVAEATGMHESTVSRVTANKSFGTDRGVIEMKFFFSAALSHGDGSEGPAAEAVRQRIRQLIDQEKPDDVLSDDTLVQLLRRENIEVARRTVAKYRESLKIPSSLERRRLKRELV